MDKKTSLWKKVRRILGFSDPKSAGDGIYIRVSTDEQAISCKEQADRIARYISET